MFKSTKKTILTKATGLRAPIELLDRLGKIAKDERRSVSNVVVYIVDQYLSSTNGKLLKKVKVIEDRV